MPVHEHIFRKYDIRGIVGEDLDPPAAEAVGMAYGSELRDRCAADAPSGADAPRVVVGEDNRPSSPALRAGLVKGLRSVGCDVIRLGTVPTPVTYFSEYELEGDGAVQVTGSHNPAEYNGIKMTMGRASIHGDAIRRLLHRIRRADFATGSDPLTSTASTADLHRIRRADFATGAGTLEVRDVLPTYVADLAARFTLSRPVRVVVDCGNGTGSLVAVDLLEAVGADVVPLYCDSDGTFPNHHPDPTVDEYVQDLIASVRSCDADLGIGFDGDADRIGVVDDVGSIVRGDLLLLLFGLDLLRRRGPGETLVFDVKCSQALPEVFAQAGGVPVMWKTGHSLVKEKMRETGARIAGELSGHICFADDYFGFDDALYAACRLLELVSASKRPLSHMVGDFPRYVSTPEIRIEVAEEEKFGIVERAREYFGARYEAVAVDGVRVLFEDGWGLVRASNTQPVIAARYEARSLARLREIQETMEVWLRRQGVRFAGAVAPSAGTE